MVKGCNGERTEDSPLPSGILFLVKSRAQIWLLGHHAVSDKLRGLLIFILYLSKVFALRCY